MTELSEFEFAFPGTSLHPARLWDRLSVSATRQCFPRFSICHLTFVTFTFPSELLGVSSSSTNFEQKVPSHLRIALSYKSHKSLIASQINKSDLTCGRLKPAPGVGFPGWNKIFVKEICKFVELEVPNPRSTPYPSLLLLTPSTWRL